MNKPKRRGPDPLHQAQREYIESRRLRGVDANEKVTTRTYWLVQGLDGTWLEPDESENLVQAKEAARELGTAYRRVIEHRRTQDFQAD